MSFWPLKDFHKLTKHWDLAFWLLVPPDTELSDSLAVTSFLSSLGGAVVMGLPTGAQSLAQESLKVRGVTGSSCMPRTVLGYAYCPGINGSVPFHSQKCPGLDDK